MKYRTIIAVLVLLLSSVCSAEDRFTGDAGKVWLVRPSEDGKSCDVFVKSLGESWQTAIQNQDGVPSSAVAADGKLHLFYADRQHVVISANGDFHVAGNLPGDLLAACSGTDIDNAEDAATTVYVLVRRNEPPAGPTTNTQPASAPANPAKPAAQAPCHCLYRLAGNDWAPVATSAMPMPKNKQANPTPVMLAVLNGQFYQLYRAKGDNANRPWVLRQFSSTNRNETAWTDLHTFPGNQSPLGMIALKDRLLIVHAASPQTQAATTAPATSPVKMSLTITRYVPAMKIPFSSQPIVQGQSIAPARWPVDAPPKTTRLGEQLALLWQDEKTTFFALCSPSGALGAAENVTQAFASMPSMENASNLFNYFLLAILAIICVGMFFRRMRTPPRPFVLAKGLVPGNLIKRLIAANIDYAPFFFFALLIFGLDPSTVTKLVENPQAAPQSVYVSSLYVAMLSLGLYVIYGTVMEMCFGVTLGKWLLRLRTVQEDGRRPGLREATLRNVTKIVELSMFQSPMAWLMMIFVLLPLLSRNRQRLGDMMARTAVVEASSLETFTKAKNDIATEYKENENLKNEDE